jgi:hypothetical protein
MGREAASSFEDLGAEANEEMKKKALNLHTASEQSAKVFMLPEFTIVDDNYIQSSKVLKTSSTQGTNPFKIESD